MLFLKFLYYFIIKCVHRCVPRASSTLINVLCCKHRGEEAAAPALEELSPVGTQRREAIPMKPESGRGKLGLQDHSEAVTSNSAPGKPCVKRHSRRTGLKETKGVEGRGRETKGKQKKLSTQNLTGESEHAPRSHVVQDH